MPFIENVTHKLYALLTLPDNGLLNRTHVHNMEPWSVHNTYYMKCINENMQQTGNNEYVKAFLFSQCPGKCAQEDSKNDKENVKKIRKKTSIRPKNCLKASCAVFIQTSSFFSSHCFAFYFISLCRSLPLFCEDDRFHFASCTTLRTHDTEA